MRIDARQVAVEMAASSSLWIQVPFTEGMADKSKSLAFQHYYSARRTDSNWATGEASSFDATGNTTGQLASSPVYSWKAAYQLGSAEEIIPALDLAGIIATTFAAVPADASPNLLALG